MPNASQTLKVLHIASGDLWAGAEVQLLTLAMKLHASPDTEVVVVLLNHGRLEEKLKEARIYVVVMDESNTGFFSLLVRLTRLARELDIDIIHTHRSKENILGSIAALLAGNIPSVRTVHGAPEHKPSISKPHKYLVNGLDNFCARHIQRMAVAVSNNLAERLARTIPAEKLCVIENGIDLEEFITVRKTRLEHINKRPGEFRIGIAGRLTPVKRVDIFIRTADYIIKHHPETPAAFHIYGDGPLRSDLEILAQSLGISQQVHFHGHRDDIREELATLDVLLMTSDHEGTPMVLLEALATGVDVIAHATGGIGEILNHGECGVLVHEHTPQGYAKEVIKLAENTTDANGHRHRATCSSLEDRFSAALNAAKYTRLYRDQASTRTISTQ